MSIVATLHAAGLTLRAEGEKLYVEPRERITDDVRGYIREHKPTILRELEALEGRRAKVAAMLRADQALRYACDVQGASLKGEPSGPVSVMLGMRDSSGTTITGEFVVPAEKWDLESFIAYWDAQGRPS